MLVAPSQPSRGPRRASRLLGSIVLVLCGVLAFYVVLHNYRLQAAAEQIQSPDRFDLLLVEAPPRTRNRLERVTQAYLDRVGRGDYAHALGYIVSEFRARQSPESFQHLMQNGYLPLTQVKNVAFWHSDLYPNGRRARVSLEVLCRDGRWYQTIFAYAQEHDAWRISGIWPPIPTEHIGKARGPWVFPMPMQAAH